MPTNTPNLDLYKKNPATDGADTFNITTMLNDNWDKIDTATGKLSDLTTTVKTNLVAGINEINSAISGKVSKSGDTMTGDLRLIDSSNKYGVVFRNDGNYFYLLVTNENDPTGSWNNLRPFSFNLSTGASTYNNAEILTKSSTDKAAILKWLRPATSQAYTVTTGFVAPSNGWVAVRNGSGEGNYSAWKIGGEIVTINDQRNGGSRAGALSIGSMFFMGEGQTLTHVGQADRSATFMPCAM